MRQSQAETNVLFLPQLSHDGGLRPALWGNWDLENRIKLEVAPQKENNTTAVTNGRRNERKPIFLGELSFANLVWQWRHCGFNSKTWLIHLASL